MRRGSLRRVVAVPGRYGELGHFTGDPYPCGRINVYGKIYDRRGYIAALEAGGYSQGPYPDLEPERTKARSVTSSWECNYFGRLSKSPLTVRRLAFIRAPYWDQELQSFVGGYFCRGCIGRKNFHFRYHYNEEEGFWAHVEKYGRILKTDDGTFSHDSPRRERQTPDDVQAEMYRFEDALFAEGMDLPDDKPMLQLDIPHNCQ
ncbi:uncharacterized protein JN550_005377 [Neoarthrinium moseri]|uniref:uncharacterized protein n=1 Tax=Neoarthrinium moseri TaxID=1658444 RepID=UPI001FDBECE6|nr:uncharacterized protein JN550_005377 [Neoarthrinium moseri]KAI1870449.1 hypothetical protein JN550_005377 [Neoarthrinium moseri]